MTEERRLVTVLFADVTGSTSLGESLDPEALRGLLGRFFGIAREVIELHGGTVEKFIGDAVMAVFGLPVAHGDDAARALAAALELRGRVKGDLALGERLPIRLGVNTGEVVASREPAAGDFLVTGDAVNVAARLQQTAEPWSIVVGERTVHAVPDAFVFRALGPIEARGKAAPVEASELVGRAEPGPVRHTPLIGREDDLSQLQLVATRAIRERRPYLVSIIAAPGVGKSRLLEAFIDRLETVAPGASVSITQCLPYGQRLTYWPLRALLFGLLDLPDDASPGSVRSTARRWLADAGDEHADRDAELLASTIGAGDAEVVESAAVFAAWRSLVELAAADRPLVLAVEDLHWSSDSLLDLVEFVLQPRADVPLVMVVLARPELLERRPNWGGGRRNHISVALEPLDDAAIAELVADLLDGPAPEIVQTVVERAGGNPFYAGEIVRSLVDQVPDLRDAAAVETALGGLPDTVQATILARLDALPGAARRLVQVGSVFGRSFRLAGAAAIDPTLSGSAAEAADELDDRDLLRRSGGDLLTFRHILIREVAYGSLTRSERVRLHEAAGSWLEASAGSESEALAELIAFHYREAIVLAHLVDQPVAEESRRRAVAWLVRAADAASAGAATVETRRHLRAAIELADPGDLPDLYLRLGMIQMGGDESIAALREAYELGRRSGSSANDQLLALALRLTGLTRFFASIARQPSIEEFEGLRAEAGDLFQLATDDRARAAYLISEGFVVFWLGNLGRPVTDDVLAQAEACAREGFEIAERIDDAQLMSAALDGLGAVTSRRSPRAAREVARRRMAIEDRLDLNERLDAHNVVAWMSCHVGDFDEAIVAADRGLSLVLPGQVPAAALGVAGWRPYAMALSGLWDAVPAAAERCRQLWMDSGRPAAGYSLHGFMAALDVARARRDEAATERWSDVLEEILGQFGEEHPTRRLLAFVSLDREALAAQVAERWEFYRERLHHVERALAVCADGRQPIRPGPLEQIIRQATRAEERPLLAQALRVRGLQHRDPADLRASLELFEAMRARPYIARVQQELGTMAADGAMIAAGLAGLEALGDVDHLGRLHAEAGSPPISR